MARELSDREIFGIGEKYAGGKVCPRCGATGPDFHTIACERKGLVEPIDPQLRDACDTALMGGERARPIGGCECNACAAMREGN
jgi:hypothetical protein